MSLRKALTVGAAILAAGLLTLTTTAPANATGGPIANLNVANPHTGAFQDGTTSFAGGTWGCIGGNVTGSTTVLTPGPGARTNFTALNMTCSQPTGVDAQISIGANCARAIWDDTNVNNGYVDWGTGAKYNYVNGTATLDASCGEAQAGPCEANVSGTVAAQYWERKSTTDATQALVVNGSGFTLNNQNFWCLGLWTGGVTLNNIRFSFPASTIDFRP